jgi:hypothetical protein
VVTIEVEGQAEESAFEIASVTLNGGSRVAYSWGDQPAMPWVIGIVNEVYFPSDEAIGNRFPGHDTDSGLRAGLSLGLKKRGIPAPVIFRAEEDPEIGALTVTLEWKSPWMSIEEKVKRDRLVLRFKYPLVQMAVVNVPLRELVADFPNGLSEDDVAIVRSCMGMERE